MNARHRVPLAVALTLSVLVTRHARAQVLSPGPLSKAHASIDSDENCSQCHESGKRVAEAQCLRCHADLRARIQASAGLHGKQYKTKPCATCHVEHLGRNARLVRWPGGDAKKLDHMLTGWPLGGSHAKVECKTCHTQRNSRGAATFLGLKTACASCHKDPHSGRFGPTCISCHNETTWKSPRLDRFDHALTRYPLRGSHQKVKCAACHHEPPQYRGIAFSTCTNCHKDPHAGRFGTTCTSCHNETSWKETAIKSGNHPGVSLGAGHAKVACVTCHDKGNSNPPSKGSECVSCHRAVHDAPFGRNCKSCHASIRWLGLPRSVGLESHQKTDYPLTGMHQKADCNSCHKTSLPEAKRYRGLEFKRCKDCHRDEHRGEFSSRNDGECAPCHSTKGYRPTLFSIVMHATTKYPLEGMHATVACSACHKGARPRIDLRLTQTKCETCHDNPHGSQFAREMKDGGCAHCHSPNGWSRPKIDHRSWPLTGSHATAACAACHSPNAEDRKSGKGASYRGAPRDCAGCHDDRHAGQFRLTQPKRECDVCHDTTEFKIRAFDHAAIAHYELAGTHANVECAKCHTTARLRNGVTTVRWRLGYRQCSDCHANPHTKRGQ